MAELLAVDVGGTTIKLATWHDGGLSGQHAMPTLDGYYDALASELAAACVGHDIAGVAMSTPGAPNKATGVIESMSAIPYIHGFDIAGELTQRLGVPVSMENDANCAALAELADGAGKDVSSFLLVVVGTGIGGAIVIDRRLWHGVHLLGGEFGFSLLGNGHILSQDASPVGMAKRYQARTRREVSGKDVFDLAERGDEEAAEEVHMLGSSLARALFSLQYCFDPQRILLGGGVSNNPGFIPMLERELDGMLSGMPYQLMRPELVPCAWTSAANLRGAVVDFEQTYPEVG
jgi:predicted NBD/HSP70 family sugar kinase